MSFLHLYYTIEILNQYGKHKNKPMKKLIISALLLGITGGGIYAREKVISRLSYNSSTFYICEIDGFILGTTFTGKS